MPIKGPKLPFERLTITPKVIANAKAIFLLAMGTEKGKVLVEALQSSKDFMTLPVRLASGGTYLLDDKAGDQLRDCFMVSDMYKKKDI